MVTVGSWRTCLSTISKKDRNIHDWLHRCTVQPCSHPPDKRVIKCKEGGLSTIWDTLVMVSQCSPGVHILDIWPRCDNAKTGGTKEGLSLAFPWVLVCVVTSAICIYFFLCDPTHQDTEQTPGGKDKDTQWQRTVTQTRNWTIVRRAKQGGGSDWQQVGLVPTSKQTPGIERHCVICCCKWTHH